MSPTGKLTLVPVITAITLRKKIKQYTAFSAISPIPPETHEKTAPDAVFLNLNASAVKVGMFRSVRTKSN